MSNMKFNDKTEARSSSSSDSDDANQGSKTSPSKFSTLHKHSSEDGAYDSDDSVSPSDWTDSDDEDIDNGNKKDTENQIDAELLQGLEEIHINTSGMKPSGSFDNLELKPKGPQKIHKIRKQGKSQTLPYHQGSTSEGGVAYHSGAGAGLPEGKQPYEEDNNEDDKMDLVLSETLKDPGFRNKLLYTLQAEVEQYPKIMTPPMAPTDCAFSDYTCYTSSSSSSLNSNYYHQYTPESLITDSPQGSDLSLEEDQANYFSSSESISDATPQRLDSVYSRSLTQQSQYSPSSGVSHNNYYQQYTPESLTEELIRDNISIEDTHENQQNKLSKKIIDNNGIIKNGKSNADHFIDNVFSEVQCILSSCKSDNINETEKQYESVIDENQQKNEDYVEPYYIDEERANKLKYLAKIIQSKIINLNEKEKNMTTNLNVVAQQQQYRQEEINRSGDNVYHYL